MLASDQEEIQKDYNKAWRNFCLDYLQIKKLKLKDCAYFFPFPFEFSLTSCSKRRNKSLGKARWLT